MGTHGESLLQLAVPEIRKLRRRDRNDVGAAGLVAGIFFAFSTFVMQALARIPQEQGIAAMQAINVTVLNPWFLGAFFGTGADCLSIAFVAWGDAAGAQRACLFAVCALYLFGCILVTMVGNVPLNNHLAALGIGNAEATPLLEPLSVPLDAMESRSHRRVTGSSGAVRYFPLGWPWQQLILMTILSAGKGFDAANMHTKDYVLMGPCKASGFAIIQQGG